jgi:hypothetical protein
MPKEPKSRTNPGESAMIMQQANPARPATGRAFGEGAGEALPVSARRALRRVRMTCDKPDEPDSRGNRGNFGDHDATDKPNEGARGGCSG